MSGPGAPLLHGWRVRRPTGPRRPPPAFVPFPPPFPRSAHAGAALRPRRARSGPAPAPGRRAVRWRRPREGSPQRAGLSNAPPARKREKKTDTHPSERARERASERHDLHGAGRPASGRRASHTPDRPTALRGRSQAAAAPGRPLPGTAATCPGRPPGRSAAAGGRGAGRRPPDSPLASPGRAGAPLRAAPAIAECQRRLARRPRGAVSRGRISRVVLPGSTSSHPTSFPSPPQGRLRD